MTQFSLFGAAAQPVRVDDLSGVLLAGGHWVRRSGTPRLSVVVRERWRAEALGVEFDERGVGGDPAAVTTAEGGFAARTGFCAELAPLAAAWTRGANEAPPVDLDLTAAGLRLWTIATGRRDESGFLLGTGAGTGAGTDAGTGAIHRAAGGQLARLGVAAVAIAQRPGPGWRVTSTRRIRRLAEIVGTAPGGAGDDWPTVP